MLKIISNKSENSNEEIYLRARRLWYSSAHIKPDEMDRLEKQACILLNNHATIAIIIACYMIQMGIFGDTYI